VRLRKVNGFYRCLYKDGRGKWRSKTTGQKTLPEAEAVAKASRIKELEDAGHVVRLTAAAFNSIVTDGTTLWAALREFPAHLTAMGRSPQTVVSYTAHVRQFANGLDGGDDASPASVRLPAIASFVNAPDIALSTRRLRHAALRAFWEFCLGSGWVHANTVLLTRATHDGLSHEQRNGREREAFTEDECGIILNHLVAQVGGRPFGVREESTPGFWLGAFLLGISTGLRIGDIRNLEWKSIVRDAAGKPTSLIVWTDKANRRVELPVSTRLAEFLLTVPQTDPRYVFPWQQAGGYSAKFFGRLCKSLWIDDRCFHSTRHHYLTKLAKSGLPLEEIMRRAGHISDDVTRRYIHTDKPEPQPWHSNGDNIVKFGGQP